MRPEVVVAAGGMIPPQHAVEATDTVDALAFSHPAIPGRTLVKLVPDAVARGSVTALGLGGFRLTGKADDIARQRHRNLGFPGWALVHDPENARFALDVMKTFAAAKKKVASKPGHARDAFQAIAEDLGRKAPHFLPSYWEEAGRAFIDGGAQAMAASAFEKARGAERQHGLAVDEQDKADAFLEFALAGALNVKTLQSWPAELKKSKGPAEAYARFRELVQKRTLGGLSPWASLHKDLRDLARAAGQDPLAEESSFFLSVLQAPALKKAPIGYWKEAAATVQRLREAPGVADTLLRLFPEFDDDDAATWLGWLRQWGFVGRLAREGVEGGAAAWMKRALIAWDDAPKLLLELVIELSDRLVAEGAPVLVMGADVWRVRSVDAFDELCRRGVALAFADPDDTATFSLDTWANDEDVNGPAGHRDPVSLAAHPLLGPLLTQSVRNELTDADFQRVAPGKSAFREARHAHLLETIDELVDSGLPACEAALETLRAAATVAALEEFPDAAAHLAAVDLAPNLLRTLRSGVFDELCWPAFDEAVVELEGTGNSDLEVTCLAPWAVVHDERRAIVVGAEGRLFAHDLKIKKGGRLHGLRFVDGQLLVAYRHSDDWSQILGYWSGRPKEELKLDFDKGYSEQLSTPPARGGGVLSGGRRLRVGDTHVEKGDFFADGEGVWKTDDEGALAAVDPETGKLRGKDHPAFLAPRDGVDPDLSDSEYLPLGGEGSPLGGVGGQYGFVVFNLDALKGDEARAWIERHAPGAFVSVNPDEDQTRVGIHLDGRAVVLDTDPIGLLRFPGAERPVVLFEPGWRDQGWMDVEGQQLAVIDDDNDRFRFGTRRPPPFPLWHHLRPRDLAGSAALRALGIDAVRALLAAAEGKTEETEEHRLALVPVVKAELGIPTDALARGVAAIVLCAADLCRQLRELRAERLEGAVVAGKGEASEEDSGLRDVLSGFYQGWNISGSVVATLDAATRFFAGEEVAVPSCELPWQGWLGREGALAFAGLAAGTTEAERAHVARVLGALARSRFTDAAGLRRLKLELPRGAELLRWETRWGDRYLVEAWAAALPSGRFLFWGAEDDEDAGKVVVECFQVGAEPLALPPEARVLSEQPGSAFAVDGAWLEGLLEGYTERSLPVDEAAYAALSEETGVGRVEAIAIWLGLKKLRSYERDPLGKAARDAAGLKLAEAKLARDTLGGTDLDQRALAYHRGLHGLPREALVDGPRLGRRLGEAWAAVFGKRIPVDDALLKAVRVDFPGDDGPAALIGLAGLGGEARWQADGRLRLDHNGDIVGADVPEGEERGVWFDEAALGEALGVMTWVYANTPTGDPLRANVVQLFSALRARMQSPSLLFTVCSGSGKALKAWFKRQGGAPLALPPRPEDPDSEAVEAPEAREERGLIAVLEHDDVKVHVRVASVADDTLREVEKIVRLEDNWEGAANHARIQLFRRPGIAALAARCAPGLLPDGVWEQDPRRSAPAVVQAAAKRLGLTEEAATLYLQLLCLSNPTRANVLSWNGWKAALYTSSMAALVEKKLVVEAKRARAGRDHFLPGGWRERKGGSLPLEEWKLPLYEAAEAPPLGQIVPLEPFGALFERAWKRFEAGDLPKYEKVK